MNINAIESLKKIMNGCLFSRNVFNQCIFQFANAGKFYVCSLMSRFKNTSLACFWFCFLILDLVFQSNLRPRPWS